LNLAAFGIMMWEAATGATAFKRLHYGGFYQAVVVQGLRPELPPGMPPDYAALMQRVSDGSRSLMHNSNMHQLNARVKQPPTRS
jgi:hypothetical protein